MHSRVRVIRTYTICCKAINHPITRRKHTACLCRCLVHTGVHSEAVQALSVLQRVLISLEDALFDKLLGVGPALQPFLKAVSPHVVFELPLLLLQSGRNIRCGQDVSLDEIVSVRACIKTFLKIVGRTLAFELESFGLEGAVKWLAQGTHSSELILKDAM